MKALSLNADFAMLVLLGKKLLNAAPGTQTIAAIS